MISENPQLAYTATELAPTSVRASACGKAILTGEHAVVYGARAVAIPLLQMRMKVSMQPFQWNETSEPEFHLGGKPVSNRIHDVIKDAFEITDIKPFSFNVLGRANLPIGAGLGSSATLCVITLKTLAKSLNLQLSNQEIAELGNRLEARFHGQPSGLDTAVVAFEECVLFKKGQQIQPITLPTKRPSYHFALVDSGIRASTLSMIRLAAPFFQGEKGKGKIHQFDEYSELAASALQSSCIEDLAQALNGSYHLLKAAGVVPQELAKIVDFCHQIGCLGAKSTGAGGGGTILALLPEDNFDYQLKCLQKQFGARNVFSVII